MISFKMGYKVGLTRTPPCKWTPWILYSITFLSVSESCQIILLYGISLGNELLGSTNVWFLCLVVFVDFLVKWHISLRGLFKAKCIFVEEQLWYYLIHNWWGMLEKCRGTEEMSIVFFLSTSCLFSNSAGKNPDLGQEFLFFADGKLLSPSSVTGPAIIAMAGP